MPVFPGLIDVGADAQTPRAGMGIRLRGATSGRIVQKAPATVTDYTATWPAALPGAKTTVRIGADGQLLFENEGAGGGGATWESAGGYFSAKTVGGIEAGDAFRLVSRETDGAAQVALVLDTENAFATSGAQLLAVQNAGTQKLGLSFDGVLTLNAKTTSYVTALTSASNTAVVIGGSEGKLGFGTTYGNVWLTTTGSSGFRAVDRFSNTLATFTENAPVYFQSKGIQLPPGATVGGVRLAHSGSGDLGKFYGEAWRTVLVPSDGGSSVAKYYFQSGGHGPGYAALVAEGGGTYAEAFMFGDGSASQHKGAVVRSLKVQTTDATVTTLYSLGLLANTVYQFDVRVVARRSDAGTENGIFWRRFLAYRAAGGAVLGTVSTPVADEQTTLAGAVGVDTDGASAVRVRVTGEAAKTVQWAALVSFVAVGSV